MTFGKRLRSLRLARGLTQQQLAELAGIKGLQISRYEQDKAQPMLDVLQQLCPALGCSADELLFDSNQPDLAKQLAVIAQLPSRAQKHIKHTLTALIGWYQQGGKA